MAKYSKTSRRSHGQRRGSKRSQRRSQRRTQRRSQRGGSPQGYGPNNPLGSPVRM